MYGTIQSSVQDNFLTAGTRSLEWATRIVEPHVHARKTDRPSFFRIDLSVKFNNIRYADKEHEPISERR